MAMVNGTHVEIIGCKWNVNVCDDLNLLDIDERYSRSCGLRPYEHSMSYVSEVTLVEIENIITESEQ